MMRIHHLAIAIAVMATSTFAQDIDPGEVIVARCKEEFSVVKANGYANIELLVEMSPSSVVRIASLTKQFTAAAILALAEDERLSLDDPFSKYVAGTPAHWRAITIRQLLSHTSGLTDDMTPIYRQLHNEFAPRDLLKPFESKPLIAPPGAAWRYSNLNYWILGLVIESASAISFSAFVNERVLQPAGLERTRYGNQKDITFGRSAGYEIDSKRSITNARSFSTSIGYSAGGYVSSPIEIAQWYGALSEGKILAAETIELALTPVRTNDGALTDFGLGWYITESAGSSIAHHGGSTIGFVSYVYWTPKPFAFAGVFRNWSDDAGEPSSVANDTFVSMKCTQ